MADADHPDPSWVVRALLVAERIAKIVIPAATLFAAGYAARFSALTHENQAGQVNQIKHVSEQAATVQTELVQQTQRNKTRDAHQSEATAINLRTSWKYLQGIAEDTGDDRDIEAAAKAKKLYDEWVNSNHRNGSDQ